MKTRQNYSLSAAIKTGPRKGEKFLLGFVDTEDRAAAFAACEARAQRLPEHAEHPMYYRANVVRPKSVLSPRGNSWRD